MDIASFSGAATVATASTIAFAVAMKCWHLIARSFNTETRYAEGANREAAQRFRDELERLTVSQWTYLGATVVFVLLFVSAHVLHAERIYAGYPDRQLYLVIGLLAVLAALVIKQLIENQLSRSHVALLRDANIAIGHHLQRIAAGFGRVYHDVETGAGVIDHLPVGAGGLQCLAKLISPRFGDESVGRAVTDENPGCELLSLLLVGSTAETNPELRVFWSSGLPMNCASKEWYSRPRAAAKYFFSASSRASRILPTG